jgi:LPS-assembly lipoprotein
VAAALHWKLEVEGSEFASKLRGRFVRFLVLAALLGLSACGFHLRQAPDFAFKSIYTDIPSSSVMGAELKRQLNALDHVQLITDPAQQKSAQVVLDVLQEQREKVVAGMSATGQVREFQLRIRFRFRLRTVGGKELIPDTEILQQRDISFSESAVLAKEAEEAMLYRNMQTEIVQQLMRRLAAVKEL